MTHTLFFYGTLCVPKVLNRVINSNGEGLTIQDAILKDHVRLHVKHQDYPAIISIEQAKQLFHQNDKPFDDEASYRRQVQGVVVEGLTDRDLKAIHEFEGDEYTLSPCTVTLLSPPSSSTTLSAKFYLYTASPLSHHLSPEIWSLERFLLESSNRWIGVERQDYLDVDRMRLGDETETKTKVEETIQSIVRQNDEEKQTSSVGKVDREVEVEGEDWKEMKAKDGTRFGREMREKYWDFEKGWINLNHGSYGSAPRPVVEEFLRLRHSIDSTPDRFMRLQYDSKLLQFRQELSSFVDCDVEDLVVVPNATHGVNTVVQSLTNEWKEGDRILYFSTTVYFACNKILDSIIDTHPHLKDISLVPIPLNYPISHDEILTKTLEAIEQVEKEGRGGRVKMALIDGLSSNPGVIVPWERLVELFREKGIISLIDAAHSIGQLPFSLRTTKPDFFVSNCHKWLMAHRGCAILYVDKKYQHLMHSFPVSPFYELRNEENRKEWSNEFAWTGTQDPSPSLSTLSALKFRRDILGGELKIRHYCHQLALEGGELVAKILGTKTMRNRDEEREGELVANMINVELPLPSYIPYGTGAPLSGGDRLKSFWYHHLNTVHRTIVPIFAHANLPWVRLSSQVYLDLSDFEKVGKAIQDVCERIEKGEHLESWEGEVGLSMVEEDE